jgi:hypothetical protein
MKLDAVLIGEAAAVRGALQVFGEVEHCAVGSVTARDDSLMCAVHVIVVPHDDGELFSLHDGSLKMGLAPRF